MEIRISDRQKKFRIHNKQIEQLCQQVLSGENADSALQLDISIVTDEEIARLNESYLHHIGYTDVISFPQLTPGEQPPDTPYMLGDVVVSPERALDQSRQYHTSFNQEFGLYIIHGILHLLGFDDQEQDAKDLMEKHQNLWFNKLLKNDTLILICEQ